MYGTYLRRELAGRKKQTIIVATGLAIAIALVMIVNALAAGVRDAQAEALESVYGVGTDLTVTGAAAEPGEGRGQAFEFGEDGGETGEDGTTELTQSRLVAEPMRATLDSTVLETVAGVDGVAASTGTLSLTNMTFSGELPQRPTEGSESGTSGQAPPDQTGGGGFGGGSFDVNSFSVFGVDPSATSVGPLSAVSVSEGRALDGGDAGTDVAVLDAAYAQTEGLAVGDTLDVGGDEFEVVGIVTSTSSDADTAANVFIPLDVAQALSGVGDVVSTVYVQADSADAITMVREDLQEALPDATVNSQSDLAATVSGSLSSASSLITDLGTWLSVVVLVVALALAVLLTMSGVSRRTREFGTLKAIGWSDRRVVGQVAGESVIQGLIGGVAGLVLGFAGIVAINLISPTISAAPPAGPATQGGPGGDTMVAPGGFSGGVLSQQNAEIVLHAPVTPWVVLAALGLALLGGLVAGAFGGWRAARLSPAEALRSVA
jgi:putative ABC transport system permease protein